MNDTTGTVAGWPASEIVDRLAQGQKMGLYHGIQALRYDGIKDSIILASLEKYDDIIADWIDTVLAGNPSENVVGQIVNFMIMTDGSASNKWPAVRTAIYRHKTPIMVWLLREYQGYVRNTDWYVTSMVKFGQKLAAIQHAGYDWPELDVIVASIDRAIR